MRWVIFRVVGSIVAALCTAGFIVADIQGIYTRQPWSFYALVGFIVFVILVGWGWGSSEIQLYKQRKREGYLANLSSLRRIGVTLQNNGWRDIRHEKSTLEEWWGQVAVWNSDVRETMSSVHLADPDNWEDIGTYEIRSFEGVSNELALHFLTMLAIRLEKLEKYINDRTG